MDLLRDEPLSRHTYYRIGGPARILAIPRSRDDLSALGRMIRETRSSFAVLGLGSNCLFSDEGFDGIVIKTGRLNLEVAPIASTRLLTGASVAISSLLRRACQEGWGGLEFLTGIPGSIGGAVRMNAGTHLGEVVSRLRRVEVFDFENLDSPTQGWRDYSGTELRFEYRKNLFLPRSALVYSAEWGIQPGDPASIKGIVDSTLARRKATQPLDFPSCGSVFKNPKSSGRQAWQVVDQLGLRGHRIGNAQIAEMHSNWILNLGGALASEVLALIELVQRRAREELGIEMEAEVVCLGSQP